MKVNDPALWDEIYEKENFAPGWATPGTDPNLVRILGTHFAGRAPGAEVHLLDIGCGNGRNSMATEALAGLTVRYTGIDFSEKAVDYCRRAHSPGKTFLWADLTAPTLPLCQKFDAVVDCGCFHAIPPEHRATYRDHLAALVNPGALVVIAGWFRSDDTAYTDAPTKFPYLFLSEWSFNAGDLGRFFAPAFTVEDCWVDTEVYRNVGESFGYTRLRPSTAHISESIPDSP